MFDVISCLLDVLVPVIMPHNYKKDRFTKICGSSIPGNSTPDYEQNRKQTVYFTCYDKFDTQICRKYIVLWGMYSMSAAGISK